MSHSLAELQSIPTDLPPSAAPHPNPLPSFWTASWACPLAHEGAHGSLPEDADVVVIGSGFTGTCAAAKIVEELVGDQAPGVEVPGLGGGGAVKVVVVEAREFCSGATGELTRLIGQKGRCLSANGKLFCSTIARWFLDRRPPLTSPRLASLPTPPPHPHAHTRPAITPTFPPHPSPQRRPLHPLLPHHPLRLQHGLVGPRQRPQGARARDGRCAVGHRHRRARGMGR